MLYFSRTKIITVILISILFSFFTLSNFTKFDDNLFNKKINLGLDLQGGSYLLLEIDNDPVVVKDLQNKATLFKNYFKEKIKLFNLRVTDTKIISFNVDAKDVEKTNKFLEDKDEGINPYYERFKTYQYDVVIIDNKFELKLSKYGLVLLKNASLDQAIEIVRRRVDEIGTNEPNILKRGNDRILVELPGLDDPMRIKNL